MKKFLLLFLCAFLCSTIVYADASDAVQVLQPVAENLSQSQAVWLPGQVQDKLKSNLQEHLGLCIVVDENAEKTVKKLQAESEDNARDEKTAIELGKMTTAKYGVFSKIRKTETGYILNLDYTDLTTGVQKASAVSKEYAKAEYLYVSTGAVDEVTLKLADKLGIEVSGITKELLSSGTSGLSTEEQIKLARQNEEQYLKLMHQYDDELRKLSVSNDISAVENKKKIEAEKALLSEKQKAEQNRLKELSEQKQQAEADAKLESERSLELKDKRDKLAKEAAVKAAAVRKLKMDRQGVLGQINVIESKKKALVDIRQAVERRCIELGEQMEKDKKTEAEKILNAPWRTVEQTNGVPTEAARKGREARVIASGDNLQNKFIADCNSVKKAASVQESSLLKEIRSDLAALTSQRKVSSMGDELKVTFGAYDGALYGWNTYLSLYSDGVLLYNSSFIVKYETLTGKKAPNLNAANSDIVLNEYENNVEMYNSLLLRGEPVIYFELDYSVKAEKDDKPSQYVFNFSTVHVINTVFGTEVQTKILGDNISRTMTPLQDIRETFNTVNIMAKAKSTVAEEYKIAAAKRIQNFFDNYSIKMVKIPEYDIEMLSTEVTQELYRDVMGTNPSKFKGDDLPVEFVSLSDAECFCDELNRKLKLFPGFRLPTKEEWIYATEGDQKYRGDSNVTLKDSTISFRVVLNNEPASSLPPGSLSGVFSVSDGVQVHFSKGNLQYQISTGKWQFAAAQYDYIGRDTRAGWIDLFGWGETGKTRINSYLRQPGTNGKISDYKTVATASRSETLTRENGGDWGVCMGKGWKTLTTGEWKYLLNSRTVNGGRGEGKSYRYAKINSDDGKGGVYGMILYPDDYTTQTTAKSYKSDDWTAMEKAGCVFLPAAGYRYGSGVINAGSDGEYWSATASDSGGAYRLVFSSSRTDTRRSHRYYGLSVRLVCGE